MRQNCKTHILTNLQALLMALLLLVAAACSRHDDTSWGGAPDVPSDKGAPSLLQLSLTMAAGSAARSDAHAPSEPGVFNENRVDNLCLFVYSHPDGINAPADTPIDYARYFSGIAIDLQYGVPVLANLTADEAKNLAVGKHVAVLINMGDVTASAKTLGEVRDLRHSSWQSSARIPDYTNFTMSTASNSDGVLTCRHTDPAITSKEGYAPGQEMNPYTVSALVERTAARIDFAFDNNQVQPDGTIKYEVHKKGTTAVVAHAYFTRIGAFNLHRHFPYAVKRTTPSTGLSSTDYIYAREEQLGTNGRPSNYVIDPNTISKNESSDLNVLFGPVRRENLIPSMISEASALTRERFALVNNEWSHAAIIGYANESTQHERLNPNLFAAGVAFEARYVPYETLDASGNKQYSNFSVPPGTDLVLYRVEDPAPQELWFTSRMDAESYADSHDETPEITVYREGKCYYTLTLRHHIENGSGSGESYAMKHAVVRNHIYRVGVNVTGPGQTDFTNDPKQVEWTIYVRKWNGISHEEIIM